MQGENIKTHLSVSLTPFALSVQAVVCVSTPRMYPQSVYFLVLSILIKNIKILPFCKHDQGQRKIDSKELWHKKCTCLMHILYVGGRIDIKSMYIFFHKNKQVSLKMSARGAHLVSQNRESKKSKVLAM